MNRWSTLIALGIFFVTFSSCAQNANAQSTYTLKPTRKTVAWGCYHAKAVPVLRVRLGLGRRYPAKRVIL